jgi:putative hydrolase of the HAD superfamily
MDTRLKEIKVLIWDFDGTFYDLRKIPHLQQDVREAEYKTIMAHTGWSREKTSDEFAKKYPEKVKSGTRVTAMLSEISISEVATESESYFDRTKYLQRDTQLISLFDELSHLDHYILANGTKNKIEEALSQLGIDHLIFKDLVTADIIGITKPSEKGFRYILEKTKLPPEVHLMIGDRELVDLVPAKKLGMKTCLVWSDQPRSEFADVILTSVYDVATLLE